MASHAGQIARLMKAVICSFLLCASLMPAGAQSSLSKLERVFVLGTEYVRLTDWARANNFRAAWITRDRDLKISGTRGTLVFTEHSRRITINDISVWISHPIVMRYGSAYISPVDLTTAVHPVLFPRKGPAGKTIQTICLDPGHGGKDPGNREGRQQEKKYTLLFANELSARLTKAGFKVFLTRTSDRFVELSSRAAIARQRGADLFLSLHFNSADGAGGAQARGVEVYCLTPARTSSTNARGEGARTGSYPGNRLDSKNMLLAYQLQTSLVKNLSVEDRGVRRARFEVLREAQMPAALIEGGFMTHPAESKRIYDSAYRRRMSDAIATGLMTYKNLVAP